MRKIAGVFVFVWTLMCIFSFALAEIPEESFAEFAFECGPGVLYSPEECCVRARYRIELPEDTSKLHEQIRLAYEGRAEIQLIEFGVPGVGGVLEGYFVCVGTDATGDMEQLPTLQDLLGRIYDGNAFDELRVTLLPDAA